MSRTAQNRTRGPRRFAMVLGLVTTWAIGDAHAGDGPDPADRLSAAGIAPTLTYSGNVAADTSGGARRGATTTGNVHVQIRFDFDRMAGVPGFSAYLDGLWIGGGQPDRLVGDAQGVSNLSGPHAVRLYEAWVQYNVPGAGLSILAGRYDLNTEFYHLASAGLFLNSAFGIGTEFGQSGFAGPSTFPDTALGLRFGYKPAPNTVLRAAILDGAPLDRTAGSPAPFDPHAGVLLVTEAAWLTRPSDADGPGPSGRFRIGRRATPLPYDDKIAVGAWYYTASFPGQAAEPASRRHGEGGGYVVLDRVLYQSVRNPDRRLTGFLQLGAANPELDRFGLYLGAGLALAGPLPGRTNDEFGVAMAMARNGAPYRSAQAEAGSPVTAAETTIEVTYLAQIRPWLAVQPDLQYVIHPNTDPHLHDAMVAQLRVELMY